MFQTVREVSWASVSASQRPTKMGPWSWKGGLFAKANFGHVASISLLGADGAWFYLVP